MRYLEKILIKINGFGATYSGCSEQQIKEIEKLAKNIIPESYKEFLELFGLDMDRKDMTSRGGFVGEDVFYEDLFDNKEALEEQLEEDGRTDLQLTDNDFIFFCSQGYIFAFFKLDEGDNPPVYGYQEGYKGETFPKLTDTLVEFYELYLEFGKSPFGNLRK